MESIDYLFEIFVVAVVKEISSCPKEHNIVLTLSFLVHKPIYNNYILNVHASPRHSTQSKVYRIECSIFQSCKQPFLGYRYSKLTIGKEQVCYIQKEYCKQFYIENQANKKCN